MSKDTIYRQDAIDAICNACGKIDCDKMDKCEKLQLQPVNSSEIPNNSDAISRQAAIEALCNDYCGGHQDCKYYPNCENLRSVQKLPSAQPERARGTWMPDTMCYYEERFICSECKGDYKVDTCMGKPMWNFCPNCGADMRQREVTT